MSDKLAMTQHCAYCDTPEGYEHSGDCPMHSNNLPNGGELKSNDPAPSVNEIMEEHDRRQAMYAIKGEALDEIVEALEAGVDGITGHNKDDSGITLINEARGLIDAARENGPIRDDSGPDTDHCGYVDGVSDFAEVNQAEAGGRNPFYLYEVQERDLAAIEKALDAEPPHDPALYIRGIIDTIRHGGDFDILDRKTEARLAVIERELGKFTQQRDFVIGQCSSLIERLAGAQVAAGLINMAAAQGFVQKETLPINQVLAQIAAANQPTEGE